MNDRIASASAWLVRGSLITSAATLLLMTAGSVALGQTKPGAQAPAAPAPAAQAQAPQPQVLETPPLVYSPWIKQCGKPQETNAKGGCITSRVSFTEGGFPMASAVLVEPEGDKKFIRVTVPMPEPVALAQGARIVVDQGQPTAAQFFTCFGAACTAETEATADTITKMKSGQNLFIQALTLGNHVVNVALPLADFKKVNEGPASDPKAVEEQQKKFNDEMKKIVDETRKKMEAQAQAQQQQQPKK
jgi:invasion protein IalB